MKAPRSSRRSSTVRFDLPNTNGDLTGKTPDKNHVNNNKVDNGLEISRLRKENDRLKKEVKKQKQTIQDAQNGLNDATSQLDCLKIDLNVVQNESDIHLDKLQRMGDEAHLMKEEENDRLKKDVKRQKQTIQDAQNGLKDATSQIDRLKIELDVVQNERDIHLDKLQRMGYEEENDRLKKEVANQKQTIQDAHNSLKDATSQLDRLKIDLDVVQNERDIHIDKLQRMGDEAHRMKEEAQHMEEKVKRMEEKVRDLQSKIPLDTPILSDGKEVTWDYWLFMTEASLPGDIDEQSEIAHFVSRCTGTALNYLLPRLREGSSNPYKGYGDVVDQLKLFFELPVPCRGEAFDELRNLQMIHQPDFSTFLEKFVRLADKSDMPKTSRKLEMYNRLTFPLRTTKAISEAFQDENVGFFEFCRICRKTIHLGENESK